MANQAKKTSTSEEQTSTTSVTKPETKAVVTTAEVKPEAANKPVVNPNANKLFDGEVRYWKNPISLRKQGIVKGEVKEVHWIEFMEKAPSGLKVSDWVLDFDPEAKRQEKLKRKMKAKLGL